MTNYGSLSINVKKDCVICRLNNEGEYESTIVDSDEAEDPKRQVTNIRVELKTAQVFHRVLNFIRSDDKLFEIEDFELLGEIIHKILFGKNKSDVRNLIVKNMISELCKKNTEYRIFLDCNKSSDLSMMSLPWEYIKFRYIREPDQIVQLQGNKPHQKPEIVSCFMAADLESKFHFIRRVGEEDNYGNASAPANFLNVVVLFCGEENENAKPEIKVRLNEKQPVEGMLKKLKKNSQGKFFYTIIESPEKDNFHTQIMKALDELTKENGQDDSAFVVHYVGHSELDDQRGKLVMKFPDSLMNWVDDREFTKPFKKSNKKRNPNLVIFQSCNSAKVGVSGAKLSGLAAAMTDESVGIEAVIGMQNEIDTPTSVAFLEEFYTNILNGRDVGYAVTAGRHILGHPPGPMAYKDNSFGSPVLFITTKEPVQLIKVPADKKKEEAGADKPDELIACPWCDKQVNKSQAPDKGNFCQLCGQRNPKSQQDTMIRDQPGKATGETGKSGVARFVDSNVGFEERNKRSKSIPQTKPQDANTSGQGAKIPSKAAKRK